MKQSNLKASDPLVTLLGAVQTRSAGSQRPFIVALDGRSGVGKSTLAESVGEALDAAVLEGDDFFAGGTTLRLDTAEQRAGDCIDWRRQRTVLELLRAGAVASYRAFDWDAFDGSLRADATIVAPRPLIVLEGVYSACPELADLLDLRVLLRADDELRIKRLLAREGTIGAWERQWHEAEEWYFAAFAPPAWFDLVIDASQCQER